MATVTAAAGLARARAEQPSDAFEWAGHLVQVGTALARLEGDWRALEGGATASVFQSWNFVGEWCASAAEAAGESPLFVVGRAFGEARFILPLAVVERAGVKVLTWLGQAHANYGMGIFHPDVLRALEPGDIDTLMTDVARCVGAAVVHLDNQPARWGGHCNPFAASLRSFVTANDTFIVSLDEDFAAQYRRLFSGRTLSGLKRKQRKLDDMGPVSFVGPADDAARREVIDWFLAHKHDQLAQDGRASPFDEPGIRALYLGMARDTAAFEIDQLTVGGTRAAMGMTAFAGNVAYLLNTVHAGGEFARSSPGALLLHRMVARAHARGARTYDFGPGELPYKLEWEPAVVPLLATTYLVRPVGLHVHAASVFAVLAKSKIKRSPALSALARAARRSLALTVRRVLPSHSRGPRADR